MADETRFLEPNERIVLAELPETDRRGAPKLWESRLTPLIGDPNWVGVATGPWGSMFAMKSNFKLGKLSKPKGHKFECEVVHLEGQEDNLRTIFFRWMGPEDPDEELRLKNERIINKLEKKDSVAKVPAPTQVVADPEEDEPGEDLESPEEAPVVTGLEDLL